MKINILFFTSTGNTLWLAEKAKEIIEQQNHEVKLYEVLKNETDFIKDDCDMIGVFYPVWGFLPAEPLWNFLKNKMPNGNNKKIFFIGNCAGIAGDSSMMCKKLMVSKGYTPFYFNHLIMPTNFFLPFMPFNLCTKVPDKNKLDKILESAEKKLAEMIADLLKNKERYEGRGILWHCFGFIQRKAEFVVNLYKKKFSVVEEKCINCGQCIRVCPTGNISKDKNDKISFGSKCIMCVKCYNLCPKDAILICNRTINNKKYKRYKGPNIKPVQYRKKWNNE